MREGALFGPVSDSAGQSEGIGLRYDVRYARIFMKLSGGNSTHAGRAVQLKIVRGFFFHAFDIFQRQVPDTTGGS